ncbi:MAG: type II toxin-antitoxin system VapC family toxin [Spirochaetaceae bacterium]
MEKLFVILLDANYLFRMLVEGTPEAKSVDGWIDGGIELCTSAIAFYEFLSGPVDPVGIEVVRRTIHGRVLPFGNPEAVEATRLFNAAGRRRSLRVDAMIAGTAILAEAELATENREDFAPFVPLGLRLIT